jgi:hypothetical protein
MSPTVHELSSKASITLHIMTKESQADLRPLRLLLLLTRRSPS